MNNKLVVSEENALTLWGWIQHRGGVTSWSSLNLADPGRDRWQTPADRGAEAKPHWAAGDPRIITDAHDIDVVTLEECKRFHIGVRRGSQGMSLKVTDGGTRRINHELAKAGEGSAYRFDYFTQEAVILKRSAIVSLVEYVTRRTHAESPKG